MAELSAQEAAIVRALGTVWNDFLALPVEHAQDAPEFCEGIHRLQDKVLARPGRRELNRADGAPAAPAWVDEVRELLCETYRFASTSPKAQENINAALELIDKHASGVPEVSHG